MPVRTWYVPLPSSAIDSAICVSVVRRSITPRRTAPPPSSRCIVACARRCRWRCGRSRRSRVRSSDREGRRPARRRPRRVAETVAGPHEDEVRVALPVLRLEALAGGVEQRLRFRHLLQVLVARRRDRRARPARRPPPRCSRCRPASRAGSDRAGRARRPGSRCAVPASPNAFENVRPTMTLRERRQLGDERRPGELGVRLVDEHDRLAWHRAARSADRLERHRHAGRIVRVGQEHDARSRRDRREHLVERKAEVRLRHHRDRPAADHFGVELEDLERRLGNDRFGNEAARRRAADRRWRSP